MTVVHSIDRAWISTGGTGARNYDEFADDAEITEIIAANPGSALAIEMPHRAPDSLGKSFIEALPDAVARLGRQRSDGSYAPAENVFVLYRITQPGGLHHGDEPRGLHHGDEPGGLHHGDEPERLDEAAYGLFAMVDTDQISASADEPGRVIRNEDVFLEKVRERVALAEATRHLLSPVLLLQTGSGEELHKALRAAVEAAGAPAVTDTDHVGRTHAIWPVSAEDGADLAALAGSGELVVADGNHRSLAAQVGGLPRFLAVITTPASVAIRPYHRLVSKPPRPLPELLDRLRSAGAGVAEAAPRIPTAGTIVLYGQGQGYAVTLPATAGATIVDGMDHALVERLVLGEALGLEAGDKRITYVGGDYPPAWLVSEVDAGRADLAILIAPVTVDDFVAVNLARQRMPRKSTWFTPKARGGLVLVDLG
jgi:uncharacterized protein (DUF1015 family)